MNENFNEKAIKEFCKQCVEHSDINCNQKELLKIAIDAARNMQELFDTGIAAILGGRR